MAAAESAKSSEIVPVSVSDVARIQLRIAGSAPLTHNFPSSSPLSAVYDLLQQERSVDGSASLTVSYPRKVLTLAGDGGKSLLELGLVPSAALSVG